MFMYLSHLRTSRVPIGACLISTCFMLLDPRPTTHVALAEEVVDLVVRRILKPVGVGTWVGGRRANQGV